MAQFSATLFVPPL